MSEHAAWAGEMSEVLEVDGSIRAPQERSGYRRRVYR
jgi:hypothetical protein